MNRTVKETSWRAEFAQTNERLRPYPHLRRGCARAGAYARAAGRECLHPRRGREWSGEGVGVAAGQWHDI